MRPDEYLLEANEGPTRSERGAKACAITRRSSQIHGMQCNERRGNDIDRAIDRENIAKPAWSTRHRRQNAKDGTPIWVLALAAHAMAGKVLGERKKIATTALRLKPG